MKFGQLNKFHKGLNSDTSLNEVSNSSLRDGLNISLTEPGKVGDLVNAKGTEMCAQFFDGVGTDFRVLGQVSTRGNLDKNCVGTYTAYEGVVYFTYDSINKSNIFFFCISDKTLYLLAPNLVIQQQNDLNFDAKLTIDAISYEDRGCYYVRWVDNKNIVRKIEVKQGGTGCLTYPNIDDLSVRPLAPLACPEFKEVLNNGALTAGSYQFSFRYYSKETCNESGWSTWTNAIPIIPDDNACNNPDAWGGQVGQPTNKQIVLTIPISSLGQNYDSIQLLVARRIDGVTTAPTSGFLLNPNEDAYAAGEVSYTGLENGVTVTLSDYVVDDLPVVAAKTITNKDERDFLGNVKIRSFELDNGDPSVVTKVQTIQRAVGNANNESAYKCEEDNVRYKSYMRDEVYDFGVFIYDEFRNGIVCPIDMTPFQSGQVEITSNGFISATSIGSYTFRVDDPTLFQVGDSVSYNGVVGVVIEVTSNALVIQGTIPGGATSGTISLLYGQSGNQGTSRSWKFPHRCQNQYSLFDENNNIMALGIRIEGLNNFPSWAKGFEIVRRKRIKDIVYQVPHIPTIGVMGGYLATGWGNTEIIDFDYDGELNYFTTKLFRLGAARNLYTLLPQELAPPDVGPLGYPQWQTQDSDSGEGEVSSLIFGVPPEYMYGPGDASFLTEAMDGGTVEVVDAIAYQVDLKIIQADKVTNPSEEVTDTFVATYGACSRENYFYNREGCIQEGGQDVFMKKIQDTTGFQNLIGQAETKIDYQLDLALGNNKITLPRAAMDSEYYGNIQFYNNLLELALQQREHPAIKPKVDTLFSTTAKNQKGVLWQLNEKLEDFSRTMVQRRIEHNDNYFKLLDWTANPRVYEDDHLLENFDLPTTTPQNRDFPSRNYFAVADQGAVAGGAYILNVKKGLGDDRYGGKNEASEWISTGVCQILSESDLASNRSFNVDVFGGDVFITKHSIKVNETSPRIVITDPTDSELQGGLAINSIPRVGVFERNIEIIDVYLESEINSAYQKVIGQYPAEDGDKLTYYDNNWNYEYHPGYSVENDVKIYIGKQEFCKPVEQFKTGVVWSDRHVRGAESNALSNVEGFNRYRANNVWILDGKYGEVVKVDTLDDKALHVFQEDKIAFQPIGVDELRTLNGALVATGTSTVLGSGDFYLQRDVGTQHLPTIQKRDGLFYGVDASRQVVYAFGSRGREFRMIGWDKMDRDIRAFLANPIQLKGHIDPVRERYILTTLNGSFAYNMKYRFWETRFGGINSAIGAFDTLLWESGGSIYRMHTGERHSFFGQNVDSEFEIVINDQADMTKVFQVIQVNANNRLKELQASIHDTDVEVDNPIQITPWMNLSKNPRNQNEYFVNVLRTILSNGVSKKLRGRVMKVRFRINNTNEVQVASVITKMRRSQ